MVNNNYRNVFESLLFNVFVPAGYKVTKSVECEPIPESSKYEALNFSLNNKRIVYRKANITTNRPGAFLAIWKRPTLSESNNNKPIPLTSDELDYLFIQVENQSHISENLKCSSKSGIFIFPVSLLIEKGIVSSAKNKGKTGFRVFPPWSQDRGDVKTKVFSESGKKTQRWQIPYFLEIDENALINPTELNKLFSH